MSCEFSWDLLVRAVDGEVSTAEALTVSSHLAECAECRQKDQELRSLSQHIEHLVTVMPVSAPQGERERLMAAITQDEVKPDRVMRRFGWGMAIAATLAVGILVAPKPRTGVEQPQGDKLANVANAIEVDGETFVALPYSNPDMPSGAPRIVQMQVPVSSLAGIGIAVESVVSEASDQDRSVLADVLLGADGQPLGVHVVSWE